MLLALSLAFYLLTAHYAAVSGNPVPAALTLLALVIGGLWQPLRRGRPLAWLGLAAAGTAVGALGQRGQLMQLLYLPPVIMNVALLLMFGRTLRPGRTPLVTRIALALGDAPSERLHRYTRAVTLAWSAFFASMAVESALMAVLARPELWSLFTNLVNYVLIGVFFLVEYTIRCRYLKGTDRGGFIGFMRALKQADFKRLARRQA